MKGRHGKIGYSIEASLQTGWTFDVYAKTSFTIIRFIDLSNRIDLMLPLSDEIAVSFCCWLCKTHPLILQASIPFSGIVPEQSIRVTVKMDNRCGFDVSKTEISLKKLLTFISTTPSKRVWTDKKTLLKRTFQGVKNGKETTFQGSVAAPPFTLPTNDEISSIIKISYFVQVSLDVVGFVRAPKVRLPVVVGTKPLNCLN